MNSAPNTLTYTDLRGMTVRGPVRLRNSLVAYANDSNTTLSAAWRKVTSKCVHGTSQSVCEYKQCAGYEYTPKAL